MIVEGFHTQEKQNASLVHWRRVWVGITRTFSDLIDTHSLPHNMGLCKLCLLTFDKSLAFAYLFVPVLAILVSLVRVTERTNHHV